MMLDNILLYLQKSADFKDTYKPTLAIELTRSIMDASTELPSKNFDRLQECFKIYIHHSATNFSNFQHKDEAMLPFIWALRSCDSKCANRLFFDVLMQYLRDQFKKKHSEYIGFLSCLFLAFE